jgi:hypothetical protein
MISWPARENRAGKGRERGAGKGSREGERARSKEEQRRKEERDMQAEQRGSALHALNSMYNSKTYSGSRFLLLQRSLGLVPLRDVGHVGRRRIGATGGAVGLEAEVLSQASGAGVCGDGVVAVVAVQVRGLRGIGEEVEVVPDGVLALPTVAPLRHGRAKVSAITARETPKKNLARKSLSASNSGK